MRVGLIAIVLWAMLAAPAFGQGQRPATHSPYYNVHHNDSVVSRQVVAEQRLSPPGRHYAAWGSGFIVSGVPGYYPGYSYGYYDGYRGPRVHRHGTTCYWVEGRYELVQRKVWVPARVEREYVPPVFQTIVVDGQPRAVLVSQGYYREHFVPSRYETIADYAWVPGYWSCAR
jgi:hypothetical protein